MPIDSRLIPTPQDPTSRLMARLADQEARIAALERNRKGLLLDIYSQYGSNVAYSSVCNNSEYFCVDAAKTQRLRWVYTPPVDVWVEVTTNVGLIYQGTSANWYYMQLQQNCVPFPALSYASTAFATATGHSSAPYWDLNVTRLFPLNAGVQYSIQNQMSVQANGVWQYYQGPDYLTMHGTSWQRFS